MVQPENGLFHSLPVCCFNIEGLRTQPEEPWCRHRYYDGSAHKQQETRLPSAYSCGDPRWRNRQIPSPMEKDQGQIPVQCVRSGQGLSCPLSRRIRRERCFSSLCEINKMGCGLPVCRQGCVHIEILIPVSLPWCSW